MNKAMRVSLMIYFIFAWSLAGFPRSGDSSLYATTISSISYHSSDINFISLNDRQAAVSDLTVTVKNINGALRNLAQVKLYNSDSSILVNTLTTNTSGQATFSALPDGIYNYEVYYQGTNFSPLADNTEYWGSGQATIAGSSQSVIFTRTQPYISVEASFSPSTLSSGQASPGSFTIKNTQANAVDAYVAVWVDQDKLSPWDYAQDMVAKTINPASSAAFPFTVTPTNPGTYYCYAFVYTKVNGSYRITDQYTWYQVFTVDSAISQIQWSGYTWDVKSGTGLGPGPNDWLANSSSVWVDGEDNLHLKIRKIGAKWYCASINAKPLLGFGEYTFQVSSNVENMDKNVVLGLFNYETDTREIDIELSRWGDPLSVAGWYNVQPSSPSSSHSFALNLRDQYSTHKFQWSPSKVFFQSYFGQSLYLPAKDSLINEWTYTGSQIPPAGNERVVLNLWLFKGVPPSDLKETEVVIKSFTFRKVGDLVIQVKNTDNTFLPAPGANGIVQLYNSSNKLICTKQTDQNGSVTFGGVAVGGGYSYRVFHLPANPATIYGQEYWGTKTDIQVADAQTTTSIFKRDQPISGIVKVYNGSTDVTGQLVEPGTALRVEQQIINPSSIAQSARASLILDIDKAEAYDFHLMDTSFTSIQANSTVTRSWNITPTQKGKYYSDGGVQTVLGNDTLISAGEAWSALPLFTVSPSFNLDIISDTIQKVTQHSTASWMIHLKNTGPVNDAFSLISDQGAFYYLGNQITQTPILQTNEELNIELRFNSEMIETGTTGKIKLSIQSNNDPKRVKEIELVYTIIESALVLTTNEVTDITLTTATSGGMITTDEGTNIKAKGICWDINPYPTVFLDTKTSDGPGNTPFTSQLKGLTSGTTYHVRAYAINSESVAYGNDMVFTTVVYNPPVAIEETILREGLKVYPNPTTGILRIEGMKAGEKTEIEVYTIDNRLIMKTINHSEKCEIDISQQVSGTYLVVVNGQRIRIVKE